MTNMEDISFQHFLSKSHNLSQSNKSIDKQKSKTPREKKSISRKDRKRQIERNNNSNLIERKPKRKRIKFSPQTEYHLRHDMEKRFNGIADRILASLYECEHCGEVCYNKMVHMKEFHMDKSIDCPHCDQLIAISDWSKHFRQCQPDLFTYICNWCQSEFTDFCAGCIICSKRIIFPENEFDSSFVSIQIDVSESANKSKDIEPIRNKDFNKFGDALDITDFEKERIMNNEFPRIHLERINLTDLDLDESETAKETSVPVPGVVHNPLDNFNPPSVKENEKIVKEIKKKTLCFVKERKTNVEVLIENNGKEKRFTLSRLMAMEEKIGSTEKPILAECTNDLQCPSFFSAISTTEMGIINEQMDELTDEEINEIIEIYNMRDYKAIENVKMKEYKLKDSADNSVAAKYVCHYCDQFNSTSFLKYYIHLKNHSSQIVRRKPYLTREKCLVCEVIVPAEIWSDHIRLHKDHISCYICKIFVHEDEYASHVTSHKDHYKCNICGGIHKTVNSIAQHLLRHRKGQSYLCEHCNTVFASFLKLVIHISLEHKKIYVEYTECMFCFELTTDIENHTQAPYCCKFKCKACSMINTNVYEFQSHFQIHASGRNIKSVTKRKLILTCSVCGVVMTRLKNALDHALCHKIDNLYTEHVVRKPRIQCEICKTTMLKSYFETHMDKHKYYDRCPTCAKFVLKNSIQDHISTHELELKCDKCDERFLTDSFSHKRKHRIMIPRPCHLCNLIFYNERKRVKHISSVHNNFDPELIQCIYCKEILFDDFENNPNDDLNPSDRIEYHLREPKYCQRRCKLCNVRHKTAKLYRSHMFNDHGQFLANYVSDSDSD